MDLNSVVVRLCSQGMEAEGQGEASQARSLFIEAWNAATEDFERCIAAHYVARHQESPADALRWNQMSLEYADAVGDSRTAGFYSSLYLNMGKAHEDVGGLADARRYYRLAESHLHLVPPGPYQELVRNGIQSGIQRLSAE